MNEDYLYLNIAAGATTLVKTGSGKLHKVVINTTAAAIITIYDSLTATGTKIATIAASPAIGSNFAYNICFNTGLTIVTAGATDLTVAFR